MDALRNFGVGEVEVFADSEGGKGIVNVELAGDLGFDLDITT